MPDSDIPEKLPLVILSDSEGLPGRDPQVSTSGSAKPEKTRNYTITSYGNPIKPFRGTPSQKPELFS